MTKVPSLNYDKVVNALRRAGWLLFVREAAIYAFKNTHRKKH